MKSHEIPPAHLAALLGHTGLSPVFTKQNIQTMCAAAAKQPFGAVLVQGTWVKLCRTLLMQTGVTIGAVCGFPLGGGTLEAKLVEAVDAIENGADEIAYVLNTPALVSEDYKTLTNEMRAMREITQGNGVGCSVIVESAYLPRDTLLKAAQLALQEPFRFFIPSTGFSASPASPRTLRLLKRTLGQQLPLWVIAGASNWQTLAPIINAGASRVSSAHVSLILHQHLQTNPPNTAAVYTSQ